MCSPRRPDRLLLSTGLSFPSQTEQEQYVRWWCATACKCSSRRPTLSPQVRAMVVRDSS